MLLRILLGFTFGDQGIMSKKLREIILQRVKSESGHKQSTTGLQIDEFLTKILPSLGFVPRVRYWLVVAVVT